METNRRTLSRTTIPRLSSPLPSPYTDHVMPTAMYCTIVWFICGLFKDTISNSGYVASHNMVITEQ